MQKYIIMGLSVVILLMAILLVRKKNDRLHQVAEINKASIIGISDNPATGKVYHVKYNNVEDLELQEALCNKFNTLDVGSVFELLLVTGDTGEVISATNVKEVR